METTILQANMTSGEISPAMHGRVDSEVYYSGLDKAENVVIMGHGGIRRRPGMSRIQDAEVEFGRMFNFSFSTHTDYLIVVGAKKISVFKDGVLASQMGSPYKLEQLSELDATQNGDVMIITHEKTRPKMIERWSHGRWTIENVPLANIPQYNFNADPKGKPVQVWSDKHGWPGVCTFFQQRLWLAGSTAKPNSVWASKINAYFDFDIGKGQKDYAIFDTLDSNQLNKIVNLYPGRNLQVYTTGAEFYNTSPYITADTSAWKISTAYGSKRVTPVMVDGAVLFVDIVGRTVRQSVYEFTEDAYVAKSISLISEHLIKDVINMDIVKGTYADTSDFIFVVNKDGTVAVMNNNRLIERQGWTKWTTQGEFIDVCVVNKLVYFMVKRQGKYYIEYMNEGTTLDHNSFHRGKEPVDEKIVFTSTNGNIDDITFKTDQVYQEKAGSGVSISEIDTHEDQTIAKLNHKVILDNEMMKDIIPGIDKVYFEKEAYSAEVGLDVKIDITTLPVSVPVKDGQTLMKVKRIIQAQILVKDSLGVYVNQKLSPDRQFNIVLDKATKPISGLKLIDLLGFDRLSQLEITQKNPLPLEILGIGYKVKINKG